MWVLFAGSFQNRRLYSAMMPMQQKPSRKSKAEIQEIISSCLNLKGRPVQDEPGQLRDDRCVYSLHARSAGVERLTVYYANAMMTKPRNGFLPNEREEQIHRKGHCRYKATAALSHRGPQPTRGIWSFTNIRRQRLRGRFTKCGICVLMKSWGYMASLPRCAVWTTP